MVAIPLPQFDEYIDFRGNNDDTPPNNIEAEEAVLGSIILDPDSIDRVKHTLRPEHFYISTHAHIYAACLRLNKKGQKSDLLQLTSFLGDNGILAKVGGRNKLACLVDTTISSFNIDAMASIIIEKATRRQLIKLGNEVKQLAGSLDYELDEVMQMLADKSDRLIQAPSYLSKEESQYQKHKRILEEVKDLFTGIPDPSYRFFKLKELAKDYGYSTNFLEQIYLKSLTGECSKLLTYQELKELGGSEIREWLLNGLIPKASTILLAADGGQGKTKLVYRIAKNLVEGKDFGDFTATGKRKILYYQGDESPGDMLQALDMMGYAESDINSSVRVRFGWSAENMPILIRDIQEFKPDFVMIDSLSTANKYSVYKESDMEYARPILEMAGLAAKHGCTFLIVHHTNKEGGVRGTTAIRNAVSEVWRLSKNESNQALPNDRILEINKSRSRSSGKKYKLFFDDENLDFVYLGQENEDKSQLTTREAIKQFLKSRPNTLFTSEEISNYINHSASTVRRLLGEMGSDGIVSKILRKKGGNLYYLGELCINAPDQFPDHPEFSPETIEKSSISDNVSLITRSVGRSLEKQPSDTDSFVPNEVTDRGDQQIEQKLLIALEIKNNCENTDHPINDSRNPDGTGEKQLIAPTDRPTDRPPISHPPHPLIDSTPLHSVTSANLRVVSVKYHSPLGEVVGEARELEELKWEFHLLSSDGKELDKKMLYASSEDMCRKQMQRRFDKYLEAITEQVIESSESVVVEPHFSFLKNKSNSLKIQGISGRWSIDYIFGENHIHIHLKAPDGQELHVEDFCSLTWRTTLDTLKASVKSAILDLEQREILANKLFDVKRRKYDENDGIASVTVPGCKLVKCPDPCGGKFVFEAPNGDRFPVEDMDDFAIADCQ